jgi:hypothetical protein
MDADLTIQLDGGLYNLVGAGPTSTYHHGFNNRLGAITLTADSQLAGSSNYNTHCYFQQDFVSSGGTWELLLDRIPGNTYSDGTRWHLQKVDNTYTGNWRVKEGQLWLDADGCAGNGTIYVDGGYD